MQQGKSCSCGLGALPSVGNTTQYNLALLGVQIRRIRVTLVCYGAANLALCLNLLHEKNSTHCKDAMQTISADPNIAKRLYKCLHLSSGS